MYLMSTTLQLVAQTVYRLDKNAVRQSSGTRTSGLPPCYIMHIRWRMPWPLRDPSHLLAKISLQIPVLLPEQRQVKSRIGLLHAACICDSHAWHAASHVVVAIREKSSMQYFVGVALVGFYSFLELFRALVTV